MNISVDYTDAFGIYGMYTQIDIVRFDESYVGTSYRMADDIIPAVLRCTFNWCAQYHGNTRVEDGKLFDNTDFGATLVDASQYSTNMIPDSAELTQYESQEFNRTNTLFWLDKDFSTYFTTVLKTILQSAVFNSSAGVPDSIYDLPNSYSNEWFSTTLNIANEGPSYSLYYGNDGNLTKTFNNIALSATNQIRSGVGSSNETGTVRYPTVYIEVTWPWLILPIILTISAAGLLAVTIWLSSGPGAMVWKSSSVALLFHGIADREADVRLVDAEAMEKKAKRMWVRLREDDVGFMKLKTM